MANATNHAIPLITLSVLIPLGSCNRPPPQLPEPPPASSASASASEAKMPPISMVDAAVVVSECKDSKSLDQRAAREAIRKLVDPCAVVPGGTAHFSATLMPDGRIELASPSGDPEEGVVPTCVLRNRLSHKVFLRGPCKFDVKLEERPAPRN